jgi:hypothetical protein
MSPTSTSNIILSLIPLAFPLWFLIPLLEDPIPTVLRWIRNLVDKPPPAAAPSTPPVSSQLLVYVAVALLGYAATSKLVPNIKVCYQPSWKRENLYCTVSLQANNEILTFFSPFYIQQYTLRKGISGKDLGKRGTSIADKEMSVLQG